MKAKPATIINKIQAELILALEQNKELSEFEIKKYQRDANSISDYVERNHVLGLLYTIEKNESLMQMHFEHALSLNVNLTVLFNYFTSLICLSCFSKSKEILYKYKDDLNTSDLLIKALNVASTYLDNDMAEFICKKAIMIKCDEEIVKALNNHKKQILQIREMTNCSDYHIELLVNICSNIIRKYNQEPDSLRLETIAGGHYVIGVDTDNLDKIVDMNFELADRIVAESELDSCKLVALFRPRRRINK